MNLHSIRWRLPLSYTAIALAAALASGAMMLAVLRGYYQQRERQYLERNAAPIALAARQLLEAGISDSIISDQAAAWSFLLQARVQVYAADDRIVADSGAPEAQHVLMISNMNLSGEPFEKSLETGMAPYSDTFTLAGQPPSSAGIFLLPAPPGAGKDVIVVNNCTPGEPCSAGGAGAFVAGAEPITQPIAISMSLSGSPYGFEMDAHTAGGEQRSTQRIEQRLQDEKGNSIGRIVVSEGPAYGAEIVASAARAWGLASLIALLLAGAAGWLASRRMTAPLLRLTEVTARMASGDLAARSGLASPDEFGALGRSFDSMAEQIGNLVGALRRFVADAAHELNTPLTALQTDLELARSASAPGERARLLERLGGQITRLQGLVRNLLDLSRLEGKTSAPPHQPLDLVPLAQVIAEVFASRAEQAEIHFELELPDYPILVSGDHAQLHTALENLLDNALKFTLAGGTARLRLEKQNGLTLISVEDTGIGIPPEDIPLLFQRFHRGRNASAYAGNGLGLAIVRAIAEAHGGEVTATSTKQGTIFRLILPLAE